VVVVIIDLLSMIIRSFVTEEGDVRRPKWWTVLLPAGAALDYYNHKGNRQNSQVEESE
jgi:hypothetical protein